MVVQGSLLEGVQQCLLLPRLLPAQLETQFVLVVAKLHKCAAAGSVQPQLSLTLLQGCSCTNVSVLARCAKMIARIFHEATEAKDLTHFVQAVAEPFLAVYKELHGELLFARVSLLDPLHGTSSVGPGPAFESLCDALQVSGPPMDLLGWTPYGPPMDPWMDPLESSISRACYSAECAAFPMPSHGQPL
jgi:hypothetical protein